MLSVTPHRHVVKGFVVLVFAMLAATVTGEELDEVIIRADRDLLSQDLMQTLSVRTVDSSTQISQNRTIGDWLATEPSMSLNGQGGLLPSYSVRGMSRSRVRTEIDGVPIITDRAAGNSASFLPPSLIRAVTAQMGGSSSLFGSDAMGGVVSIRTRSFSRLNIKGAFQTLDNASRLTVGGGPSEDTSLGLAVRRADESSAADGTLLNTGYRQGIAVFQHERAGRNVKLRVNGLVSLAEDIGKSSREYPESISRYPHERHGMIKVELERADEWLLRFYEHRQDWQTTTKIGASGFARNRYRSDTLGSLFYLTHTEFGGLGRLGVEWLGRRGVSIRYQEEDPEGALLVDDEPVAGKQDNLGFFVDQQWTAGAWDVGIGLRYDHISQAASAGGGSEGELSQNVRLNWHLSERATVFARWSTGFRAPTLSERYYRGVTPRGELAGNPQLDAEESNSSELGFEVTRDRFSFSLAGYRTVVDDYIERFQKNATTRSYRNIDEGVIRGYEFRVRYEPSVRWTHALSYGHQSGRESASGIWLADLNPNTWRYRAVWRPSWADVSLDLSHREGRSDAAAGEEPLGAVTLVNIGVSWSIGQRWEWGIACTNCSDQTFYGAADDRAALQPGRAIAVNFAWKPISHAPK